MMYHRSVGGVALHCTIDYSIYNACTEGSKGNIPCCALLARQVRATLGRFRTSCDNEHVINSFSNQWYGICKRKLPTYRIKSTKSYSFGTSRTCLNEVTRDDVMIWTHVGLPTNYVFVIVFVLVRNLPIICMIRGLDDAHRTRILRVTLA
jgi:hypothetical protein